MSLNRLKNTHSFPTDPSPPGHPHQGGGGAHESCVCECQRANENSVLILLHGGHYSLLLSSALFFFLPATASSSCSNRSRSVRAAPCVCINRRRNRMLLASSVFLDCFSDLFFLADTEGMEDWVSFLRVATLVFALVFALVFPYFPTPQVMWERTFPTPN